MWLYKFIIAFLLLFVVFIIGCAPQSNLPVQDLQMQWDVSPGIPVYANDGVDVCLDMSYNGEKSFNGEVLLGDNVNDEQFGGLADTRIAFSSNDFREVNGVKRYKVCSGEAVVYDNFPFDSVDFIALVKVEKREHLYSNGFCVPSALQDGRCGLRASAGFQGSALGSAAIEFVRGAAGGRVYVTIPLQERCGEIIGKEEVFMKADSELKGFTKEDVSVSLRQGGITLDCEVGGEEKAKNRKTIICKGDIPLSEEYQEEVEVNMDYGCRYNLRRTIMFKKMREGVVA